MTKQTFLILAAFATSSCSINQPNFNEDGFQKFTLLKIDKASKNELSNGAKDISPDRLISLGESIYPNSNKYILATPKTFERRVKNFQLTTDYYYSTADSTVRVMLYQWDKIGSKDQKKDFQKQFNQLKKSLTDRLGEPTEVDIEQKKFNEETFRDGIKWMRPNSTKAYLFMFGNDRTKYRQIRLAIYKD